MPFSCWCKFVLFCLVVSSLPVATGASPLPPKAVALLRGVRRVVFLGDSITQGGEYVADIHCWLLSQGVTADVLNLGLSSETGADLTEEENSGHLKKYGFGHPMVSERLERTLTLAKPDLIFACYGMNDCSSLPSDESGTKRFGEAMTRLRDLALKSGAKRVVLCTPPIHDNKKDLDSDPMDQNLTRYSTWLLERRKAGWNIVDIHTPMRSALEKRRAAQPEFVFANDGVHPGREGHWLMAQCILKDAFGANVESVKSAEELFPANGAEIRGLVVERMRLLTSAWMTQIGHKRPGVPGGPGVKPGPSIAEAEEKAKALSVTINQKLHP